MKLDGHFKRRIHIVGKPDELTGRRLNVFDLETGERIEHIHSAIIYLNATKESHAELTYYVADANGKLLSGQRGEPIEESISSNNPEISLSALEVFNPDE